MTWALLSYSQYNSIYWFPTGTTSSLLQGLCSHTPSTTPFTGFRLVLRRFYCMGFAPILLVLLHLLPSGWYFVKFITRALLPYSQYYSVYRFSAGTMSSLLHVHCSHTASTTPFNNFRLVLRGVYCTSFAPTLPVTARLLVPVWFSTGTLSY
jgi:hypothetical protein